MLRAQYIGMSLATVMCEFSLNHWFATSLFVSLFVCTGRHNKINIYGLKYRIQGQFSKNQLIQLLVRVSTSGKSMRWENSSKDWSTRNRKKKSECFAKFIKRIRRGLKNIQLLSCNLNVYCSCKLWIWFKTKLYNEKIDFFINHQKKLLSSLSSILSVVLSTILPLAYLA